MAAKAILVLCAQALLIQSACSQVCTSRAAVEAAGIGSPFGFGGPLNNGFSGWANNGIAAPACAYDGLAFPGAGFAGRGMAYDGFYSPAMEFTATSGGALPVTSSSAMAPIGISIVSDNVYEGALNVVGELPFVGTTGLEGVLATAGSGAINHACGNGLNAMTALSGTSTPASVATAAGPAFGNSLAYDGLYGTGLAGSAYGSGLASAAYGTGLVGANAIAYDRMMAPSFAAPITAYDAMPFADAAWAGKGLAYGSPIEAFEITATSGGALPVSSASAIPPTGIAVESDNAYEGILAVGGELPFVGTVGVEGVVPSAGAGAVNHACGNGRNAMISETTAFTPAGAYANGAYAPMGAYGNAGAYAPNAFAPGFGAATLGYQGTGRGCGCAY